MSVRITGGALGGRVVPGQVPAGVRPTAARAREALFSILGQDLSGWAVLDAFGGSGLLGFEALSRGAARLVTIEPARAAARHIREAALALGVTLELRTGRFPAAVGQDERFDLVLLDPPYAEDPAEYLRAAIAVCRGVVVLETAAKRAVACPEGATLVKHRAYGDTALHIFEPAQRPSEGEGR